MNFVVYNQQNYTRPSSSLTAHSSPLATHLSSVSSQSKGSEGKVRWFIT